MGRAEVRSILDELARRDPFVLDEEGKPTGAYPFTEHATSHSVRRGGLEIRAMCAIDALGIGAMLGEDVEVLSSCRGCGCTIRVGTAAEGMALRSIEPATAVVWLGETYHGNCGATSLCASIAFFCSDGHLDRWRSSAETGTGRRLAVDEAHQIGCAIFGPTLLGTAARPQRAPNL
jgi:mercuric reductase